MFFAIFFLRKIIEKIKKLHKNTYYTILKRKLSEVKDIFFFAFGQISKKRT